MFDLQKFADGVHDYIARALKPIAERLAVVEARAPERGEKGEKGDTGERGPPGESIKGDPGENGKSVTADEVLPELKAELQKAISEIPVPKDGTNGKDGRDGVDGKSVTTDEVLPTLRSELHKAVEAIPVPKDGKDGRDAYELAVSLGYEGTAQEWIHQLRGKDGLDGKSITPDEILPTVKQWFDALPRPVNGKDGIDGKSITVADVSEFMEASMAKWALEFERRASDLIHRCIDRIEKPKDGVDGKDGSDGLGFDDMEVLHDGERTFTLRFVRGEKAKEFAFKVPVLIERGVYRAGQNYEKGDGVTMQGSFWVAQKDTAAKPGESTDWRMAVKKGRDGRDGEKGPRGPEGPAKRESLGSFTR